MGKEVGERSRGAGNAKDDLKPCTERQSASCPVIWMSSCGETDSAGHTKTASTTSENANIPAFCFFHGR